MTVQHQARKRFGQNFLVDQEIIRQIIAAIGPKPEDNLIEIGPGTAALTEHLIPQCPTMRVVELDRDLVAYLSEKFAAYPDFQIFSGDALKTDFAQFYEGRPMRLVGNLPYNISSPLLFHLMSAVADVDEQVFMLQAEVVERMAAQHGDSEYGRLSVMLQSKYHMENVLDVPPECFDPPPKVNSAIVKMIPRQDIHLTEKEYQELFKINLILEEQKKNARSMNEDILIKTKKVQKIENPRDSLYAIILNQKQLEVYKHRKSSLLNVIMPNK